MKFTTELVVVGMKFSKGTLENGTPYDSTKAYCLMDMDTRKGEAAGQSATEYNIGESTEFEKYKHLTFPFKASVDLEMVTTGKTTRTIVHSIRPVATTEPGKKAA